MHERYKSLGKAQYRLGLSRIDEAEDVIRIRIIHVQLPIMTAKYVCKE